MKALKYTLLLVASFLVVQVALASDAGGPPKSKQLIGFWKMETWPNPSANKVNPWPLPYQWFGFYKDGRLISMMSTKNANYTKKDLAKIFSEIPTKSPKYKLKGQFLTVRDPNIKGHRETWGVNLFAKDVGRSVKKGDLVMSLARDSNGEPIYYRLLRKLK